MLRFLILFNIFLLSNSNPPNVAIDDWTWIFGSNTVDSPSSYNPPSNIIIPTPRYYASNWLIEEILITGFGLQPKSPTPFYYYNDMSANILSNDIGNSSIPTYWLGGTNTPYSPGLYNSYGFNNISYPSAKSQASTWSLNRNNTNYLYQFGGGTSSFVSNELFVFFVDFNNISLISSHWLNGCASYNVGIYTQYNSYNQYPSSRRGSSIFTYNNDIYLLCGTNKTAYFNDVFRFNPDSNDFIWISGSDPSNYVDDFPHSESEWPNPGDVKQLPSRYNAVVWSLETYNSIYLFGGRHGLIFLSDLWKSVDGGATWMFLKRSNSDLPPQRSASAVAVASHNNFQSAFLFGGYIYLPPSHHNYYNDLYIFNPINNSFILLSGDTTYNIKCSYPPEYGARTHCISSRAAHGMFYLDNSLYIAFGNGFDNNTLGSLNNGFRLSISFTSDTISTSDNIIRYFIISFYSIFLLLLTYFVIFKYTLFFRANYDSIYIILCFLSLFYIISDIILIVVFINNLSASFLFIIFSLSVILISFILNCKVISSWNKKIRNSEDSKKLSSIHRNSVFYFILTISSINPSFLLLFLSNTVFILPDNAFIEVLGRDTIIYPLLYDGYSLLPQSIILFFYIFYTQSNFFIEILSSENILLLIVFLTKCISLIIALIRIILFLKFDIKKDANIRIRTVHPKLVSMNMPGRNSDFDENMDDSPFDSDTSLPSISLDASVLDNFTKDDISYITPKRKK